MAFTTITDEAQEEMGVSGLPDTPELDTSDMQAKFDELGNAAIDWIQTHVTELEATTAAASIGCVIPTEVTASSTTIQAVINAIARLAVSNTSKAHAHSNKTVLDGISENVKASYDSLVSILGSITAIDSATLVPSATSLPSSQAVATYISAYDISEKLLDIAYPIGTCVISATSPGTTIGGTWTEVTDTGISSDYTVWKRTL